MKKFAWLAGVVAVLAVAMVLTNRSQAEDKKEDKPKLPIKEIMKKAHAGRENSLRAKVIGGKASKEQKEELLAFYVELSKNTPPKGEKEAWTKRTGNILKAAKAVVAGDAGGPRALTAATNCMACHNEHRPAK